MKTIKPIIGLVLFLIFCIQCISESNCAEIKNQIVLKYERTVNGTRFFTPATPLAIGLVPVDAAAPLAPQDLSICKMEIVPLAIQSFEHREVGKLDGIMFRCGENKYIFQSLAVMQEHK
jgi:hypothetical protein